MLIKNWGEFQHYKNRDPKWIKLYKKILDDPQWHSLDGQSCKVLVMLWLLASEQNGALPAISEISFRLRMPEKSIESICSKLSHWLVQPASKTLADSYQPDSLELEREKELEKEKNNTPHTPQGVEVDDEFEQFWDAYPKKVGKKAALAAWKKAKDRPKVVDIIQALDLAKQSSQWTKENGQFIPLPSTWLNQGRWDDHHQPKQPSLMEEFLARGNTDANGSRAILQRLADAHRAAVGPAVPGSREHDT